jgi:hypothetical protein
MASAYPNVNGVEYSWSHIEVTLPGAFPTPIAGISSVKYSDQTERELVRGAGQVARGFSAGEYSVDSCSIACTWGDWRERILPALQALAANQGLGVYDLAFTMLVSYEKPSGTIITDRIEGCRVKKIAAEHETGAAGLKTEIELDAMLVGWGRPDGTTHYPVAIENAGGGLAGGAGGVG